MKTSSLKFEDIPEESLLAFVMLRDLHDFPLEFDKKIKRELDEAVENLSTKPDSLLLDLEDLTTFLPFVKIKISR